MRLTRNSMPRRTEKVSSAHPVGQVAEPEVPSGPDRSAAPPGRVLEFLPTLEPTVADLRMRQIVL